MVVVVVVVVVVVMVVMMVGRPLSEIPTSLLVLDKRPISKAKHATSLCKHHSQGNDQTCLDHLLHLC